MKTYKILFQVFGEKKAMIIQADSVDQAREILKNKVVKIDSVIDKTEPTNVADILRNNANFAGLMDFFSNELNIKK
jgi:hypothetical protein